MKQFCIFIFLIYIFIFNSLPASADTIDVAREYKKTIGQHMQVYRSKDVQSSMNDALKALRNGDFSTTNPSVINFGIGSKPVWLALQVKNSDNSAIHRNLLFATAWLDKIDVYFLHNNRLANSYHVGDSLVFSERPQNHRFFVTGHDFEYGETTVLIPVE